MGSGNQNAGPQACAASALPAEPSLGPLDLPITQEPSTTFSLVPVWSGPSRQPPSQSPWRSHIPHSPARKSPLASPKGKMVPSNPSSPSLLSCAQRAPTLHSGLCTDSALHLCWLAHSIVGVCQRQYSLLVWPPDKLMLHRADHLGAFPKLATPLSSHNEPSKRSSGLSLPGSFWKAPLVSGPGNWHSRG